MRFGQTLLMGFTSVLLAVAGDCEPAQHTAKLDTIGHNVILFVADGLRGRIASSAVAPEIVRLRNAGSAFPNSHSVFPTFTTANASVLATGHQLGDTGDLSNVIYTGRSIASAGVSVTPFLENDAVLGERIGRSAGTISTRRRCLLHGIGLVAVHHGGLAFPWGTLVINVMGSALMGLVVGLLAARGIANAELRLFLTTGIIGGFTTWSTFSLDAFTLWERGQPLAAVVYVAGSLILSIVAIASVIYASRRWA